MAATPHDVAREAGVGVGTVHRRFADEDESLDALFDLEVELLASLARQAAQEPDAVLALRGVVLGVMEARATDRALGAVVLRTTRGASFATAVAQRLGPAVEGLVKRARAAGGVREGFSGEDVGVLAVMVGTVADHTRDLDPGIWRRYAQLLLDGMQPCAATEPLAPGPLSSSGTAAALSRAH